MLNESNSDQPSLSSSKFREPSTIKNSAEVLPTTSEHGSFRTPTPGHTDVNLQRSSVHLDIPLSRISTRNSSRQTIHGSVETDTHLWKLPGPETPDPKGKESHLPPMDRGRDAWIYLAAGSWIEALIWGFYYSYGVFQDYYMSNAPFSSNSRVAISLVGTISIGLSYFVGILAVAIFTTYPQYLKHTAWAGLLLCCIGLLAASFCETLPGLIATQGVLFGIGGAFWYFPAISLLSEWFDTRRGFGSGIVFGGSGVGGVVFPLVIDQLLRRVGYQWTLRIWMIFTAVTGSIAVWFCRHRVPPVAVKGFRKFRILPRGLGFLLTPVFIVNATVFFIQALGYFAVSLYLPTFTSSLGLPPFDGTLVLAVFNAARTVSFIAAGYFCDRWQYSGVMAVSGVSSAISAYLLFGYATNLGLVFAFVIVFGVLSGGFSSIQPVVSADVASRPYPRRRWFRRSTASRSTRTHGDPAVIYLFFALMRGFASVLGPTVAGALYQGNLASTASKFGTHGFEPMILFVGTSQIVAAVIGGGAHAAESIIRKHKSGSQSVETSS